MLPYRDAWLIHSIFSFYRLKPYTIHSQPVFGIGFDEFYKFFFSKGV